MILGVRPGIHEVQPHVEEFFFRNRSRNKPPVTGSLDKFCSILRSVKPQIGFIIYHFILAPKSVDKNYWGQVYYIPTVSKIRPRSAGESTSVGTSPFDLGLL